MEIVGEGSLREMCEEGILDLGLSGHVQLCGARSHDDVKRKLSNAGIFIQHSQTASNGDQESQGISLLEAMAAGCPVVATRVGGVAEAVVHGATGLLVEPAASAGLASALEELLAAPKRLEIMGKAGRMRAESEFSVRAMADHYARIYGDLVERAISVR